MSNPLNIRISSAYEIKTSINGKRYRHLILEDISNFKKVDYVIFENKHQVLWWDAMNSKNEIHPGEIQSLKLSFQFLSRVKTSLALTVKPDDIIDIVVWYWSEWVNLPMNIRVLRSFEDQVWRFRSFPNNTKGRI